MAQCVYMKKYKLLSVIAILFLASCNLNTNNKTNNISTSSTSKPVIQPTTTVDTKTTATTKTTEDIISTTIATTIKPTVTQPTQVETKTKQPTTTTTTNSPLKEGIIYDVFGQDVVVYDVDDENPYGIKLSKFGSNINAIFYEDNLDNISDPYENVNKASFYSEFEIAYTYEDAYYRTKHKLMSGDITPQTHIPNSLDLKLNGDDLKCNTGTYILSPKGEYIGYVVNSYDDERIIYYGAAYTSLNDVCAYLLAFGEVPINSYYDTGSSGKKSCIYDWGEYGRVNYKRFSGDTSKYPYEPLLPTITNIYFQETDFGTIGGYYCGSYYEDIYNDGKSITRGAARIVFTADYNISSIDERYVFYTYNHYNDFQEYLNYDDGFGTRFGNESAGNPYCYSGSDFKSNYNSPTQYEDPVLMSFDEILKYINK